MQHAHRLSVCAEGEIDAFISNQKLLPVVKPQLVEIAQLSLNTMDLAKVLQGSRCVEPAPRSYKFVSLHYKPFLELFLPLLLCTAALFLCTTTLLVFTAKLLLDTETLNTTLLFFTADVADSRLRRRRRRRAREAKHLPARPAMVPSAQHVERAAAAVAHRSLGVRLQIASSALRTTIPQVVHDQQRNMHSTVSVLLDPWHTISSCRPARYGKPTGGSVLGAAKGTGHKVAKREESEMVSLLSSPDGNPGVCAHRTSMRGFFAC